MHILQNIYYYEGSEIDQYREHRLRHPAIGLDTRHAQRFFSRPYPPDEFCGLSSLLPMKNRSKSSGVEAKHSSQACADIKKAYRYTSTLPYTFKKWYLINKGTNLPLPSYVTASKIEQTVEKYCILIKCYFRQ